MHSVPRLATSELNPGGHITNDIIRNSIIRNYISGKRRSTFPTADWIFHAFQGGLECEELSSFRGLS